MCCVSQINSTWWRHQHPFRIKRKKNTTKKNLPPLCKGYQGDKVAPQNMTKEPIVYGMHQIKWKRETKNSTWEMWFDFTLKMSYFYESCNYMIYLDTFNQREN